MSTFRMKARAGFSLAELLIALTLTAVVGAAVTSLFVAQSRFFDSQAKQGGAREVSRAALNVLMADLRMVENAQGVVIANDSVLQLRVPFSMGIICAGSAAQITALMLPIADEMAADRLTSYRGYMFRPLANGTYTYVSAVPAGVVAGNANNCTAGNPTINPNAFPNPRVVALTPGHANAQRRFPIMLYGDITYRFAASTSTSGRALYRQAAGSSSEELVAPFANTARFRFHSGAMNSAAQNAAPSPLSNLTGIELVLDGVSERPNDDGTLATVPFRTSVYFQNRVN